MTLPNYMNGIVFHSVKFKSKSPGKNINVLARWVISHALFHMWRIGMIYTSVNTTKLPGLPAKNASKLRCHTPVYIRLFLYILIVLEYKRIIILSYDQSGERVRE
jgi:hypothetical protein